MSQLCGSFPGTEGKTEKQSRTDKATKGSRGSRDGSASTREAPPPHLPPPPPPAGQPGSQAGVDPSLSQVSRISQESVPECQTGTGFTPRRQFISKRGGRSPELDFCAHPKCTVRDLHVGFDVPVIRWSAVSCFISTCWKARDFLLVRWRPWGGGGRPGAPRFPVMGVSSGLV